MRIIFLAPLALYATLQSGWSLAEFEKRYYESFGEIVSARSTTDAVSCYDHKRPESKRKSDGHISIDRISRDTMDANNCYRYIIFDGNSINKYVAFHSAVFKTGESVRFTRYTDGNVTILGRF